MVAVASARDGGPCSAEDDAVGRKDGAGEFLLVPLVQFIFAAARFLVPSFCSFRRVFRSRRGIIFWALHW